MNKKLLFIVNVDWFFLSHRLPIAIEALSQGYEVHVAAGITDKLDVLLSYGLIVHPLAIGRSSTGFVGEMQTFFEIFQVLKKVQPQLVHLVTIKPVLFGGIAARLAGIPCCGRGDFRSWVCIYGQGIEGDSCSFFSGWPLSFGVRQA